MDLSDIIKAVIMGVVEGLTEFLPISSTGHLIVTSELIGFMRAPADEPFRNLFEIVIQLGAILAVIALFRQRVWTVVSTLQRGVARVYAEVSRCLYPCGDHRLYYS